MSFDSSKTGLLFPTQRIYENLQQGEYSKKIEKDAAVYLSAVLEYLTAEVIELAGNSARDKRRKRILPSDIDNVINSDEELNRLLGSVLKDQTFNFNVKGQEYVCGEDGYVIVNVRERSQDLFTNESAILVLNKLQWPTQIVSYLQKARSNKEFNTIVCYVRNTLSYKIMDGKYLHELYHQCKDMDDKCLEKRDILKICKWPHQTKTEALLGYIFFPIQFEDLAESLIGLQQREHLQDMLSISARFKNTLAQRHMIDILCLYNETDISEEIGSSDATSPSDVAFEKYYGTEALNQLEQYTVNLKDVKNIPIYMCGLLNIMEGNIPLAKGCFKAGSSQKDPRCMMRYIMELKLGKYRDKLIENLKLIHPGYAAFVSASSPGDSKDRIKLYHQAGDLGVFEGYKIAGNLSSDNSQKCELFLLGAQNHILECWDSLAKLYQNSDDIRQVLRKKGEYGDEDGFVQLGEHLILRGQKDLGMFYYRQAGLQGLDKMIEQIDDLTLDYNILIKKRIEYCEKRLEYLLQNI